MRVSFQKGVGLVEVLVAAAIIVLIVLSLFSAFTLFLRIGLDVPSMVGATLLAEEGVEAVKYMRDGGWNQNIAPLILGTPYYLATTSISWTVTATPRLDLGKFTRTVRFYAVNRDSSGTIVSSGGTLDSGTRKVVVDVWWPTASGSTTRFVSTYLTNFLNN